jgi:hypothetical protein
MAGWPLTAFPQPAWQAPLRNWYGAKHGMGHTAPSSRYSRGLLACARPAGFRQALLEYTPKAMLGGVLRPHVDRLLDAVPPVRLSAEVGPVNHAVPVAASS